MSLRSHESIYSTWSPASPTFSNASISTSGQYGEDEGPVSPRSISLAPYEDDERLHSIFVAYITYLCDHSTFLSSLLMAVRSSFCGSGRDYFDGRSHRSTPHGDQDGSLRPSR